MMPEWADHTSLQWKSIIYLHCLCDKQDIHLIILSWNCSQLRRIAIRYAELREFGKVHHEEFQNLLCSYFSTCII